MQDDPIRSAADATYVAAQTALADLEAQESQIAAILGLVDTRETRLETLAGSLTLLQETQVEAQVKIDALRGRVTDLAIAEAALRRVRSFKEAAQQEVGSLREENAALNAQIRTRSDEAVEEDATKRRRPCWTKASR